MIYIPVKLDRNQDRANILLNLAFNIGLKLTKTQLCKLKELGAKEKLLELHEFPLDEMVVVKAGTAKVRFATKQQWPDKGPHP
jgi:hypothetical protein